jgi:hypothetical protein
MNAHSSRRPPRVNIGTLRRSLVVATLALAGCATPPASLSPNSPCGPMVVERIYFGMSYAAGTVGEADWRAFVARSITPRFPDGLTIYEATGQWRDAKGQVVREPTRVVEVLHPEGANPSRLLAEIAAAYKQAYGQESVLIVRMRAEACF